jgi:hypothetical protein
MDAKQLAQLRGMMIRKSSSLSLDCIDPYYKSTPSSGAWPSPQSPDRRRTMMRPTYLVLLLALSSALAQQGPDPRSRDADPVVLKGGSLANLLGQDPGRILGFSWDGAAFQQVPVQVDEMHLQMWETIKKDDCLYGKPNHAYFFVGN